MDGGAAASGRWGPQLMGSLLLLFPGQGSQSPGMAEHLWEFPTARATFAEAGEALGWDIGELCRHGTMEELTRTDRTQLTILTCSVATWRLLQERGLSFAVAAGHSLGEYSALVATGHMAFADALRVVDVRGRAMQACGEEREGAMAAIIGLDGEAVDEICSELGDVWTANYNSPGQVVVSGSPAAVRAAGDAARGRGAKRVLPLPVSGAFHTPFMAGAAQNLSRALAQVTFADVPAGGPAFFSTTEVRYPATQRTRRATGAAVGLAGEVHAEHGGHCGRPRRSRPRAGGRSRRRALRTAQEDNETHAGGRDGRCRQSGQSTRGRVGGRLRRPGGDRP